MKLLIILCSLCVSVALFHEANGGYDGAKFDFRTLARVHDKILNLSEVREDLMLDKRGGEESKKLLYILSPISDQVIDVAVNPNQPFEDNFYTKLVYPGKHPPGVDEHYDECRTIRSSIELSREADEIRVNRLTEGAGGLRKRTCRALVQLNRCEGWCSSSLEPSVKSEIGFKKVSIDTYRWDKR